MSGRVAAIFVAVGALGITVLRGWERPRPLSEMRLDEFGAIPVVYKGRVKPADTFARTLLRIVSERESFRDAAGRPQAATRWLLDVMAGAFGDGRARGHRVFRIVDPQLLQALGLQPREGYRYALEEFAGRLSRLAEPLQRAHLRKQAGATLDPYERHLLTLERGLDQVQAVARLEAPHWVPPSRSGSDWRTLAEALQGHAAGGEDLGSHAGAVFAILKAYAEGDAGAFNERVAAHLRRLEEERPGELRKARLEVFFNRLDPFGLCRFFYLAGFGLIVVSWLVWGRILSTAAYALVGTAFALHTLALGVRMYLSGRPPVTNLYSSAVFVGWGSVALGLILERLHRRGVGSLVAASAGFVPLLIAHVLAADGDTMEVLQAVLDTQFWLATHVTTITIGYSATAVAGLLGVLYVLRGVLTSSLTADLRASLGRMIYGTICFATFFSFVGTVLGGLWADDSWGRFWGWDPKENGALMIVLWNALILHARWGGMVRERGLALLAVFGNIVVGWSWFGVNELNVGLHSYGFTEGRAFWLMVFVLSQLAVIGVGLLPGHCWRSPEAVRSSGAGVP